jgi:hypothetical protein
VINRSSSRTCKTKAVSSTIPNEGEYKFRGLGSTANDVLWLYLITKHKASKLLDIYFDARCLFRVRLWRISAFYVRVV